MAWNTHNNSATATTMTMMRTRNTSHDASIVSAVMRKSGSNDLRKCVKYVVGVAFA